MQDKKIYIDNLEKGMLVAFQTPNGLKSGRVTDISPSSVSVDEYSGEKMQVSKQDIVWVKTGKRWPGGIFSALREGANIEDRKNS